MDLSPSTIYRWVAAGYDGMTNMELRRKVGYRPRGVSVNLIFTSFTNQTRRSRKGGFTACANVFSPIPVTP